MISLDIWGNYADIVSVPLAIIGIILIVRQLSLSLHESEREHQRRQNEMTLNAYNAVRGDLRNAIRRVREELGLNDMFDDVTEEHLKKIINNKPLRDDVARVLGYLNKFSVGIKYDVFNLSLINDLSGTFFIRTYKQFKPYIDWVRKDSEVFYLEYERIVEKLERMNRYKEIEDRPL